MTGRRFAYFGVVVGLAVSVAANVAHAASVNGGASPGALALAGFWPLSLFLALEVLTRTTWAGARGLAVARGGVGLVALVAASLSYAHLRGLLITFGEPAWSATVGPLGIDGLMTVSAAALLAAGGPVTAPDVEPALLVEPAGEDAPGAHLAPQMTGSDGAAGAVGAGPIPRPERAAAASVPTRRTTGPAPGYRTERELLPDVIAAIQAGRLPARPSAAAIRGELGCPMNRARGLRDVLASS